MNTFPIEIWIHILDLVDVDLYKIATFKIVSKDFKEIIIHNIWKIEHYHLCQTRDYEILSQFKHKIDHLWIEPSFQIIKYNLNDVNYEKLHFVDIDFKNVRDFKCVDVNISMKCKKIYLVDCNYTDSFVNSFIELEKCTSILIMQKKQKYYLPTTFFILKASSSLEKLEKIHVIGMELRDIDLYLLSDHKLIKLYNVKINGCLNRVTNYSELHITDSFLNNEKIEKMILKVITKNIDNHL